MTKVVISVIMSTYNDADFITHSIDGVINQTFSNWEFIIIDDASTDNTAKIINKYLQKDKRIRYFRNKTNKGLIANLNKGIQLSNSDLIARIDGDDFWSDDTKLEKQYEFMRKNKSYGLVGTWATAIYENGEKLCDIKRPVTNKDIKNRMLIENGFIHSTVMFRKKMARKFGYYDPNHTHIEDYGLWLRLGKISSFHNIPEKMINYRVRDKSLTHSNYIKHIRAAKKIISEFKDSYPNYTKARIIWHLRGCYPFWFRAYFANKIKEKILHYDTLKF